MSDCVREGMSMGKPVSTISLPDLQKMLAPRDVRVKPTDAQLAKGEHHERYVMHVESGIKAKTHVTTHDPVQRWKRDGRLSDSQETAILHVQALWGKIGALPRVTATYGEATGGSGSAEYRALTEIEAREDLHRIQDYVPAVYFNVFENVCRFGMAAGVAGNDLGFGPRSASDRAHTIVCFVADIVAMKERL